MLKERLIRLTQELGIEMNQKLQESKLKELEINEKMANLRIKMMSVIREKCKEAVMWFELNSGKRDKFSEEKKVEGTKYKKEIQECSLQFDYGLKEEMIASEREIVQVLKNHNTCGVSCIDKADTKQDDEIKNCFKNCYAETFKSTEKVQSRLTQKIEQSISNLNKL